MFVSTTIFHNIRAPSLMVKHFIHKYNAEVVAY